MSDRIDWGMEEAKKDQNPIGDVRNNSSVTPVKVLKQYFGYESFREGQEILVQSILKGRDALGIMPTGAGKSICYQVPALILPGITIVISPLISLMKDQVSALNEAGIHAAYINSSLSAKQVSLALNYAKTGRYRIIYVAPERLETAEFLDFALNSDISMITVDEAHCISQWGQDFRPSYLKIVKFIEVLPKRPVISAYTATATKEVMEDIICVLKLKTPELVVTGFDRKNLYFEVRTPKNKDAEVLDYVKNHPQEGGIIYCNTRNNVDELRELLCRNGIEAARYHAGMGDTERNQNQEDFIYDRKQVMVATNAFGMGIDKSNVRYVIHYNMPKNMEGYYQEAGRAGRDGEAAECILLYGAKDVQINRFLIERGNENEELTSGDRQLVLERDMERLKKMTFYCFTRECLREYILHYFGQYGKCTCNNCSNCLGTYEETDVTEISKDLIGCIKESGQRYGINVIVSTLLGKRTAKITVNQMIQSSYYGKRAQESEAYLKQILNKLLVEGYLSVTNDKFSVIKLTGMSAEILEDKTTVIYKLPAGHEADKASSKGKALHRSEILTSRGLSLFHQLRQVRNEIAAEEGMPPYIIFSDKTLTDMCVKLPFYKEEMLTVSGVGENKYQKFGQRFLKAIEGFTNGKKEILHYEEIPEEAVVPPAAGRRRKQEFCLTEEMKEAFQMQGTVTISQFVDELNEMREKDSMKKLTSTKLTARLREEDYLIDRYNEAYGNTITLPTEKGRKAGITTSKRVSQRGNEYEVIMYDENARQLLLKILEGMSETTSPG